MRKKILLLITLMIITIFTYGCTQNSEKKEENLLNIDYTQNTNELSLTQYDTTNPVVAMYIENYGSVVIELYPEIAPNTVNNFISLVKSGFYDNNTFHRLVPGFVLQGGDPSGTGTGGPGYTIKGEFTSNGFTNNLKHTKGIVSMARTSISNDTAGSQFFIMLDDAPYLDEQYATFGKVIDGWSNIEKIVTTETISDPDSGKLSHNLTIKKAVVDLKGKSYPDVEKIEKYVAQLNELGE